MISKMFHERIHLIWMLLLLPCNFVTRIKLELIYIWSKRSILVHLGGFHLLMCEPVTIENDFAVCTNRWNILCQWLSLDKILFVVKGLLSLPNFLILVKQGVYYLDIFYFWQITKSVLSSASYKEDCSAETVFWELIDSGSSLPVLPWMANIGLHNAVKPAQTNTSLLLHKTTTCLTWPATNLLSPKWKKPV